MDKGIGESDCAGWAAADVPAVFAVEASWDWRSVRGLAQVLGVPGRGSAGLRRSGPLIATEIGVTLTFSAVRFWSVLSTGLAMATGFAHLLALPNKMALSGSQYLAAQQAYRGWAFLGIVILLAIACDAALVFSLRRQRPEMLLAAVALASLLGTQILFWVFTFPANQATRNWTVLPADWPSLRTRWEYSHGASAVLELVAVIALLLLTCRVPRLAAQAGRNASRD